MKKILMALAFVVITSTTFAQDFTKLKDATFKNKEAYKPAEKQVLECANYMFSTPYAKDDVNRLVAFQYIFKWMEGTPDYSFEINEKVMNLVEGNKELLPLYFSAICKVAIESKEKLTNEDIYSKSSLLLADYCGNSKNNMKPSKELKKIIKSKA